MSAREILVRIDRVEVSGAPVAPSVTNRLRDLVERELTHALAVGEAPEQSRRSRAVVFERAAPALASEALLARTIVASVIEAIGVGPRQGAGNE